MSRPLRLPPLVRAPLTLVSAVLLLAGGIPVATFPFLAMDASHYRTAIGVAGSECPKDPLPTGAECWSAGTARVIIQGAEQTQDGVVSYLVVEAADRAPVRENIVEGASVPQIDVGTTVTLRYWHADVVQVLPPVDRGQPQVVLPTRDNPSYRAAHFPAGGAVAALLGIAGFIAFGVPLVGDAKRWWRRRRIEMEAETAAREARYTPGFARGLARYGMSLQEEVAPVPEKTITGQSAWKQTQADEPPPQPNLKPGGAGWNIRTR